METPPTSLRIPHDDRLLLDAWARFLTNRDGHPITRVDVIHSLLIRATPPRDDSTLAAAVRGAHAACTLTAAAQ